MPPSNSFQSVNDDSIAELILSARKRVVLIAPAVSEAIALAIARQWPELGSGAVSVITDLSETPYRMGFGDLSGLKILIDAAATAHAEIQVQDGLRLGVVIVDEAVLVFAPTVRALESQPDPTSGPPNGLFIDQGGPSATPLAEQAAAHLSTRPADEFTIKRVTAALEQNPPKRFEMSRLEWVFNAAIEFVELELKGASIERRVAPVPDDLLRLILDESSQRLLKTTFHLLGKDEVADGFEELRQKKQKVVVDFLDTIPGYGTVIRREKKGAFLKALAELEKHIDEFASSRQAEMETRMNANKAKIVEALLEGVLNNPPSRWSKFSQPLTRGSARRYLHRELSDAFGSVKDLLTGIRLDVKFKGVTYEMLNDLNFRRLVRKKLPDLDVLHEEHEAAKVRPGVIADQDLLFPEEGGDD